MSELGPDFDRYITRQPADPCRPCYIGEVERATYKALGDFVSETFKGGLHDLLMAETDGGDWRDCGSHADEARREARER